MKTGQKSVNVFQSITFKGQSVTDVYARKDQQNPNSINLSYPLHNTLHVYRTLFVLTCFYIYLHYRPCKDNDQYSEFIGAGDSVHTGDVLPYRFHLAGGKSTLRNYDILYKSVHITLIQ